ncbi:uncharacterized protein LOC122248242 [Penaeus japonicus]|uniref:uncharacterized protein LOC122248242 n=1 Tax=Penaeus japonicus TaxID=27405 RepID=UPI001C70DE34|nr:uncharacterized protein LOC122248242 [Penaeus japonicus]
MKKNATFKFFVQDHYLPEEVNFWTMAIVAVGTGFILTVAVSIYLICQTRLERPLPAHPPRIVRHISHGPDALPLALAHAHRDLHDLHDLHDHHLDDLDDLDDLATPLRYLQPSTTPIHDLLRD